MRVLQVSKGTIACNLNAIQSDVSQVQAKGIDDQDCLTVQTVADIAGENTMTDSERFRRRKLTAILTMRDNAFCRKA